MSELQELVDEALADWYTASHKEHSDDDISSSDLSSNFTVSKDSSVDWVQAGLDPRLIQGVIENLGIKRMSPIQKLTIPAILSGQCVIATAETGSGKTLAFLLPICQRILQSVDERWQSATRTKNMPIRCLALSPTREIAMQTRRVVEAITQGLPITSTVVCGGLKHIAQEQCLRRGVSIVCACPGRILDVLYQETLLRKFGDLSDIVLDEADRMLGLGFADDVEQIFKILQPYCQRILLFSASLPQHLQRLAEKYMSTTPMRIGILDGGGICRCENIQETVMQIPALLKLDLLRYLLLNFTDIPCSCANLDIPVCRRPSTLSSVTGGQCIIFTKTKARANRVCEQLRLHGYLVERIHGNRSQTARVKALSQFVSGACHVLVATDVAARGIDLYDIPVVINFDMPGSGEEYTHRAGRTGRAGREGHCWSFISDKAELEPVENGLERNLCFNIVSEFEEFDLERMPSFVMTETGHQEEMLPAPPKKVSKLRHQRQASASYNRHQRLTSGQRSTSRQSIVISTNPKTPYVEIPRDRHYYRSMTKNDKETNTPSTCGYTPAPAQRRIAADYILQMEPGCGVLISDKVVNRRGEQHSIRPAS